MSCESQHFVKPFNPLYLEKSTLISKDPQPFDEAAFPGIGNVWAN